MTTPSNWLGKTLVYADGRTAKIINVDLKVNGVPCVGIKPAERPLVFSDTYEMTDRVSACVAAGVWILTP